MSITQNGHRLSVSDGPNNRPSSGRQIQPQESPWQASPDGVNHGQNHAPRDRTYPFRNYWTAAGDLSEVLLALPTKRDADSMIEHYYTNVDPLYPVIQKSLFKMQYDEFWKLPVEERQNVDLYHIALQFILFANGRLYMEDPMGADDISSSETYLSCCYRALCLASFLSKWSIETVRVLMLICNYFVTANRTADAWTFSGILQKQAYGLGLHRNPDDRLSLSEKQLRCRLWQSVMFQDVSLSYHLELVPATMHHSIDMKSFPRLNEGNNTPDLRMAEMLSTAAPIDLVFLTCQTDIDYVRAMWCYARFMQTNVCLPVALGNPIVRDAEHKKTMLTELELIHAHLEAPFNTNAFRHNDSRVWRQIIMVSSNYCFALTMLHLAQNTETGVRPDVHGACEASNKAMSAFFALSGTHRQHATMWTAANTRAYAQTALIGNVLSQLNDDQQCWKNDPWLQLAIGDFDAYVDLLTHARGAERFEVIKEERLALFHRQRMKFPAA